MDSGGPVGVGLSRLRDFFFKNMIFLMFSLWLCFGRAFNHFTHAYF